jgi:hypothetical protein
MTETEAKCRKAIDAGAAALIDGSLAPYGTDTPLIRLGDRGDDGSLVPDDPRGIAACHSPAASLARPPDRRHDPGTPALAFPGWWSRDTVTGSR